ncbi:hypothetical protein [Pelagibacterium limicola]|uniref:hypothetical protein n=1 Tax=Pelagibacterium limicola TaxID=2791022 RepID=UPI0018B00334|nr:hypothetical protein [Pelagibacterium limicola]
MANRLVLGELPSGEQGLRVSVPGTNVLNANLQGRFLSFDSEWLASSRIVTAGSVALPTGNNTTTVNFGVTLPEPPVVIGMERATQGTPSNRYSKSGGPLQFHVIDWDDAETVNALLDYKTGPTYMRVFNNRFVLPAAGMYRGSGNFLHYIVLRP